MKKQCILPFLGISAKPFLRSRLKIFKEGAERFINHHKCVKILRCFRTQGRNFYLIKEVKSLINKNKTDIIIFYSFHLVETLVFSYWNRQQRLCQAGLYLLRVRLYWLLILGLRFLGAQRERIWQFHQISPIMSLQAQLQTIMLLDLLYSIEFE